MNHCNILVSIKNEGLNNLSQKKREHLSKYLLLSKRYLLEYIELLEKKRQVVFYGPPGTGIII